jgi:hypothetical protein
VLKSSFISSLEWTKIGLTSTSVIICTKLPIVVLNYIFVGRYHHGFGYIRAREHTWYSDYLNILQTVIYSKNIL